MIEIMIIIYAFLYVLLGLTTIVTGLFSFRLSRAFREFQMKQLISVPIMLEKLPSVSICIPARNERHAMTQCLEKVLASTYPKIEVIVHDDESADETSALIKAFAHDGVRFVQGRPLPEGWLGKNNALNSLLGESSGTYVLFMDVDTLVEPDTIGQLVSYAESQKASMLSVLPARYDGYRASVLFGTLRYFWELVRDSKKHPAASSSAWMINRRRFIKDYGDFTILKDRIQPESEVAKEYSARNEYRFLISTKLLGLGFEKKWQSQVDTSIRLLYPLAHNHLFGVIGNLLFLLFLNVPLVSIIIGLIDSDLNIILVSLLVQVFAVIFFSVYLRHVRSRGWLVGSFLWPYLILQELVLFVMSIVMYKTNKVTWKGRPVLLSTGFASRDSDTKSRSVV